VVKIAPKSTFTELGVRLRVKNELVPKGIYHSRRHGYDFVRDTLSNEKVLLERVSDEV
jgi:hypothetical protein